MPQARSSGSGSSGGSSRSGQTRRATGNRSTGAKRTTRSSSSGASRAGTSARSTSARSTSARSTSARSTRSRSSASGASRGGASARSTAAKGAKAAQSAVASDPRVDAVAQRIRKLNERIIEASKDAGETTLSSYERALKAIAASIERGPGRSDVEWVSALATTQAKFIRDVTNAWTSAARGMLK
jgi:hypothetical protein